MIISIIVAVAENNVIGYQNQLPWHLPADTTYFKNKIQHKAVIMGRKSYESPNVELSQRKNIIVTRQEDIKLTPNSFSVNNIEQALNILKDEKEVFILGGQSIYQQTFKIANKLYYTRVQGNFKGDTFFPKIDWKNWQLENKQSFEADSENLHKYSFEVYLRRYI